MLAGWRAIYLAWLMVWVGATGSPLGAGRAGDNSPSPKERLTLAVNIVRLINTAEAEYRAKLGHYAK